MEPWAAIRENYTDLFNFLPCFKLKGHPSLRLTVNAVLPGPTLSDGFKAMMQDEQQKTGKSIEQLGRDFVMARRPARLVGEKLLSLQPLDRIGCGGGVRIEAMPRVGRFHGALAHRHRLPG